MGFCGPVFDIRPGLRSYCAALDPVVRPVGPPAAPSDMNVEAEVLQRDTASCLHQLLSQLSIQEQDIIALKYGADFTNRAIADVLSISESNVGTILHRVIKKLKLQWELTYA